jgi:hypothetical protein
MIDLILPLLVVVIGLSWWLAIHYAPGALSRVLPRDLTFFIGVGLFVFGAFGACYAVYRLRDPALFLGALVQCFSATWFMLAPSAGSRGDPEDASMIRNLAAMLGAGAGVLLLSLYVRGPLALGGLQLWLILFSATVALQPRVWRNRS